jgi:G6PDH family F420-dependent oxidoreductase
MARAGRIADPEPGYALQLRTLPCERPKTADRPGSGTAGDPSADGMNCPSASRNAAGFEALWISDHFHPWLDEQGNSSFVWSVIGAISQVTTLPITTAVTCPTTRIHPAIVAQAAATAGLLTGGKFNLGVGTGEALNEHVTGEPWPAAEVRREMLEEAVGIIAELFAGGQVTRHGKHYTVETARLYSRPAQPPPIYVSGFGEQSAELAARIADGYICIGPEADLVKLFRDQGGGSKPVQGRSQGLLGGGRRSGARDLAAAVAERLHPGESAQLLPTPRHFSQLAPLVTDDMVTAPARSTCSRSGGTWRAPSSFCHRGAAEGARQLSGISLLLRPAEARFHLQRTVLSGLLGPSRPATRRASQCRELRPLPASTKTCSDSESFDRSGRRRSCRLRSAFPAVAARTTGGSVITAVKGTPVTSPGGMC